MKADESILLVGEEGEKSRSKSKTFQLRLEMVPQHISHSLAEKIFFIGESIQLFESDRRVEVQGAVLRDREAEFYQVQYSTVLYGTVYNRTVHYDTVRYSKLRYNILWYSTVVYDQ